jgi:murein tripeptide amidase MpaA
MHADFRVSPTSYYNVARRLAEVNLSHTIRFTDIGQLFEREQQEIALRKAIHSGKAFDFANYHTLAEIETYLVELNATSNGTARVASIGKTYEKRDIWGVRISSGGSKPVIYADCAMHCREWVTTASCLWMIEQLVNNPSTEATAVLNNYDILMVPASNPDGYVYTWTTDRLWRKNRQPTPGAICNGTDPNRNFDSHHCAAGASTSPCSDTYCGPSPFSSQEAAAMRDAIIANRGVGVISSVSIHSYSQYWMSAYGWNTTLPTDYPEILRVMEASVKALEAVHNTKFTYGSIANVIYVASGSTADWTYEAEKIRYSYALELRDTGRFGFELPANQIIPTAEETYAGLLTMAKEIKAAPKETFRNSHFRH